VSVNSNIKGEEVKMLGFNKDEAKKDPKFKGSMWEKLGLSEYLCPECSAHLKETGSDLICLNACHLPKHWQKRMGNMMKQVVEKQKEN